MWFKIQVKIGKLAINDRDLWVKTVGIKTDAAKASTSKLDITGTERKVTTGKNQLGRKIVALKPDKTVDGGVIAKLEEG